MAIEKHVAVVQQGAKAVQAWQKENRDEFLDLSESDLSKADLNKADLSGANCHLANLDGANLGEANMVGVVLKGASLKGASLTGALLTDVDLSQADLTEAIVSLANLEGASLYKAELSQANLYLANLRRVDLKGANLKGANLSAAILKDVDLSLADLSGADLKGADLFNVKLFGADLSGADLTEADLSGAKLERTLLRGANLAKARLGGTLFSDVDLSDVQGLEEVHHVAPSTIGIDTVYRSGGKLPKDFLLACGVPPDSVSPLLSRAQGYSSSAFTSCFLSYHPKDQEFVETLTARLREEQVRIWEAADNQHGWKTPEQIDQAIRSFDQWFLILSANSLKSDWTATVLRRARKLEGSGVPKLYLLRLVDVKTFKKWAEGEGGKALGGDLSDYPIADFSFWKEQDAFDIGLNKMLRDLRGDESPKKSRT